MWFPEELQGISEMCLTCPALASQVRGAGEGQPRRPALRAREPRRVLALPGARPEPAGRNSARVSAEEGTELSRVSFRGGCCSEQLRDPPGEVCVGLSAGVVPAGARAETRAVLCCAVLTSLRYPGGRELPGLGLLLVVGQPSQRDAGYGRRLWEALGR